MSQKIVIKANVKREPQDTVPTVSYVWNWRRIVSISMLVLMTSAAVIYGLTSAVNAEQGEHPNEQEHFLSFKNSVENDDTLLSDNVENQLITEASIDPMLVVQAQQNEDSNNSNTVDDLNSNASGSSNDTAEIKSFSQIDDEVSAEQTNVVAESNIEFITDENTQSLAAVESGINQNIIEDNADESNTAVNSLNNSEVDEVDTINLLPEIENDDGALTGTEGFSPTAQVASVALGAQIDTGKISRAVLTRKVSKREPTNVFAADIRLSQFEEDLSFFSELKNLQGQEIKHVWSFEGNTMAEIALNVTSSRYRTYSTKNIMDSQTGHWRVDVVDEQGNLIAQKEFRILAD
jgi:hypothetical protein